MKLGQYLLLRTASEDALFRLQHSKLSEGDIKYVRNVYYHGQEHASIFDFLDYSINQRDYDSNTQIFMQVMIHHISPYEDRKAVSWLSIYILKNLGHNIVILKLLYVSRLFYLSQSLNLVETINDLVSTRFREHVGGANACQYHVLVQPCDFRVSGIATKTCLFSSSWSHPIFLIFQRLLLTVT